MNAISINAAPFTFGARMEAEAVPKTPIPLTLPDRQSIIHVRRSAEPRN